MDKRTNMAVRVRVRVSRGSSRLGTAPVKRVSSALRRACCSLASRILLAIASKAEVELMAFQSR